MSSSKKPSGSQERKHRSRRRDEDGDAKRPPNDRNNNERSLAKSSNQSRREKGDSEKSHRSSSKKTENCDKNNGSKDRKKHRSRSKEQDHQRSSRSSGKKDNEKSSSRKKEDHKKDKEEKRRENHRKPPDIVKELPAETEEPISAVDETPGGMYDDYEDDFDYEEDFDEGFDDESENVSEKQDAAGFVEHQPTPPDNTVRETHQQRHRSDEHREKSEQKTKNADKQADKPEKVNENELGKTRKNSETLHIDFAGATTGDATTSAAMRAAKKRAIDLLKLIDMDDVTFSLLQLRHGDSKRPAGDIMPGANQTHAQTQTGEDRVQRDTQTEEVEVDAKWSQQPACDRGVVGGERDVKTFDEGSASAVLSQYDSTSLAKFVKNAGQLIIELILENTTDSGVRCEENSKTPISVGHSVFTLVPLVKSSAVQCVRFHADRSRAVFVSSIFVNQSPIDEFRDRSVLCVWSVTDTSRPAFALIADEFVNCCCFGADRVTTVFAGLIPPFCVENDGSLTAWSLVDAPSGSLSIPWKSGDDVTVLPAAFHSVGDQNAASPIVAIDLLNEFAFFVLLKFALSAVLRIRQLIIFSSASSVSTHYSLCVLERSALRAHVWTVIEHFEHAGTDEFDFAIAPGAELKLMKRSVIEMRTPPLLTPTVFSMCHRGHSVFVGADTGRLVHLRARQQRADDAAAVKSYANYFDAPSDVTSIEMSPFENSIILKRSKKLQSGSSDGVIRLYSISSAQPIDVFYFTDKKNIDVPVTAVAWSKVSVTTFYSVHDGSSICVWELRKNRRKASQVLILGRTVTSFDISVSGKCDLLAVADEAGSVTIYQTPELIDSEQPNDLMNILMRKK